MQPSDRERWDFLLRLLDNAAPVTLALVSLKAEKGYATRQRHLDELVKRRAGTVVEVGQVSATTRWGNSHPEGGSVVLRIAQQRLVSVFDTGGSERLAESALAEAWLATHSVLANVEQDIDLLLTECLDKRVKVAALIARTHDPSTSGNTPCRSFHAV